MTTFIRNRVKRAAADPERGWPEYLFGGRVRTSTVVLVIAFLAIWWVYDDHAQSTKSTNKTTQVPATQIVPPGFVPDPNYTWVPRTQVQAPPRTTETPTPIPTTTTPPPTTTTTTTPPPPFGLPPIVLPPPFGPPVTTTEPPAEPGQAPAPGQTTAPPAEPGQTPAPPPLIPGLPQQP